MRKLVSGPRVIAICALLVLPDIGIHAARMDAEGLIVRIYNSAGTSRGQIDVARGVADRILRDAAVQIGWRDCAIDRSASVDYCDDALGPLEVVVRLVRTAKRPSATDTALGFSYIDTATGTGTLATVFVDRIGASAGRVRGDVATILGRVIAHEIGHLLVGTTSHASHGIMRGHWPDTWLAERRDSGRWRFSADEALFMRQTLLVRSRVPGDRVASADQLLGQMKLAP